MTSKLTRERIELIANFHRAMTLPPSHAEIEELARMALAAMDSEPVAFTEKHEILNMHATGLYLRAWPADRARNAVEGYTIPLYRHAQPVPVVPDDVLNALQDVARIRADLNNLDGDCRGVCSCLWEAEERLLEIVAQRSAMLSGGKS